MSGPTSNGRASFNKFAWLKVMQSDTTLPDTAFRIGVAICTTFTRADGTGWAFDLDDLAAEMGDRAFAQNTVKAAVSQLVSRGHVVETYRSHGGRGCRWRASFDLKPVRQDVRVSEEPARSGVRVSTEPARADVRVSGGNPHVQTTKPARLDVKTRTFGRTKNRPDLREDPVSGTSSGTSTGGSAREAEPATPEPYPSRDDPPKHFPERNNRPPTPEYDPFDYPDDDPDGAAADDGAPPTPEEVAAAEYLLPHPDDRPAFTEPEPSRYCSDHPNDTTKKCEACGVARRAYPAAYEAWDERRNADVHAAKAGRRAWIDACLQCEKETGWLLGADRVPVDPAVRCKHERLLRAYAARHDGFTSPARRAAS